MLDGLFAYFYKLLNKYFEMLWGLIVKYEKMNSTLNYSKCMIYRRTEHELVLYPTVQILLRK